MRLCSSLALAWISLGAGCGSDANYTLQLVPVVPLNQAPFAAEPEVWIAVRDPLGNDEWDNIGALSTGSVEERGFGPLDQDRVGVALGAADSPADDPGSISAYGETTPLALAKNKEEVELNVLVSLTGGIGALDTLETPAFGGALAVLDDGRMYLFGGSAIAGGPCTPTIHRAQNLNSGAWTFIELAQELPEGMCHAKATVVNVDGAQQIVITGGEASFGGYDERLRRVTIYDPETESVVWSEQGDLSRAKHTVSVLPDERLLMVGYHWTDRVPNAPLYTSYEVFDPSGPGFVRFGTVPEIDAFFAMATPATGGVTICGGGRWTEMTVTPGATCGLLSADGSFSALPSLPLGIMGGSLTQLSDGRLLLAGGLDAPTGAGLNGDASNKAYILDPIESGAQWTEVGSMASARAFTTMVADGLGGAVIVGGAAKAWGWRNVPEGVATCGERFVPDASGGGSWVPVDPCSDSGTGMDPDVFVHPYFGAFILGGRTETAGGSAVGIISRGPSN